MSAERLRRSVWLGTALLCPVIALQAYFAGGWYSILHSYSLGMFFGIVSYVCLANTLIISARIRYFDRLFGHDRVMVFHGRLAGVALVFAFAHAVLKTAYYGLEGAQVSLGIAGLTLFTAVAVVTVLFMVGNILHRIRAMAVLRAFFVERCGFDYTRLKLFHNLTAAALAVITIHVLMASATAETWVRSGIVAGWGVVSLSLYLYHKVVRVIICYRRSFRVTEVRRVSDSIVELRAVRPDGSALHHRAGQFGFFRILSPACGIEEHPFTISSPPGSETLGITVKALGDYSAALPSVSVGAKLLCDGPYGKFTPIRDACPYLFVAGGIGITPFMSIVGEWEEAGISVPVVLLWSVRTRDELTDDGLFERVAHRYGAFTYVPVVTREAHLGAPARIDSELLSAHIAGEDIARTLAYVCGPDPLRRATAGYLRELGMPRRAVHYEAFSS